MNDNVIILGGPAFALAALALFAIPSMRPKAYQSLIACVALAMLAPILIALAADLWFFGLFYLFLIRPVVALLGGVLSFRYFRICRDREFPLVTALPSGLLLLGALFDLYFLYALGPEILGGGLN